jgi:beta-glucosidase
LEVRLDRWAFSFYDVSKKDWRAEAGEFSVLVGASSEDVRLEGKFKLKE